MWHEGFMIWHEYGMKDSSFGMNNMKIWKLKHERHEKL